MKRSPAKLFRSAPLQRLTVRPIEDPSEQAALDERLARSNVIVADVSAPVETNGAAASTSRRSTRTHKRRGR
jgi:hypothetical protein